MTANGPKSYTLIFTSHISTVSPSGFSKGNLGLYEGKHVSGKNQSFSDGAVGKPWATDLRVAGSKLLGSGGFL